MGFIHLLLILIAPFLLLKFIIILDGEIVGQLFDISIEMAISIVDTIPICISHLTIFLLYCLKLPLYILIALFFFIFVQLLHLQHLLICFKLSINIFLLFRNTQSFCSCFHLDFLRDLDWWKSIFFSFKFKWFYSIPLEISLLEFILFELLALVLKRIGI